MKNIIEYLVSEYSFKGHTMNIYMDLLNMTDEDVILKFNLTRDIRQLAAKEMLIRFEENLVGSSRIINNENEIGMGERGV